MVGGLSGTTRAKGAGAPGVCRACVIAASAATSASLIGKGPCSIAAFAAAFRVPSPCSSGLAKLPVTIWSGSEELDCAWAGITHNKCPTNGNSPHVPKLTIALDAVLLAQRIYESPFSRHQSARSWFGQSQGGGPEHCTVSKSDSRSARSVVPVRAAYEPLSGHRQLIAEDHAQGDHQNCQHRIDSEPNHGRLPH